MRKVPTTVSAIVGTALLLTVVLQHGFATDGTDLAAGLASGSATTAAGDASSTAAAAPEASTSSSPSATHGATSVQTGAAHPSASSSAHTASPAKRIAGPATTASTATTAGTSPSAKVWTAEYMSRNTTVTRAQALADASHFDRIFAHKGDYTPFLADMHAVNPRLKVIAYFNGTFARSSELAAFAESSFAHDAQGRRIRSGGWDLYLMNPADAAWRNSRVKLCLAMLAESGYDACGADNVGTAVLLPGYVSGLPINPATNKVYTSDEWVTATSALCIQIRSGISPRALYGNSLGNGSVYFASTRRLLNALDGASVETFLRGGRESITSYPTVQGWKANVDMLVDAATTSKDIMTATKVWTTGTQAQKDQWHLFAYSTYLLGAGPNSRFWFSYVEGGAQNAYYSLWSTAIGAPSAGYVAMGSVFGRDFTGGKVLVNPDKVGHTVSLGGTYHTLDGVAVTSVTLAPHTGLLLTF